MKNKGYTLIELIITMAIIMTVIIVCGTFIGGCVYYVFLHETNIQQETAEPPAPSDPDFNISEMMELNEKFGLKNQPDQLEVISHAHRNVDYTLWENGEITAWGDLETIMANIKVIVNEINPEYSNNPILFYEERAAGLKQYVDLYAALSDIPNVELEISESALNGKWEISEENEES